MDSDEEKNDSGSISGLSSKFKQYLTTAICQLDSNRCPSVTCEKVCSMLAGTRGWSME